MMRDAKLLQIPQESPLCMRHMTRAPIVQITGGIRKVWFALGGDFNGNVLKRQLLKYVREVVDDSTVTAG